MFRKLTIFAVLAFICTVVWMALVQPAMERANMTRVLAANDALLKEIHLSWQDMLTLNEGRLPTNYVSGLRSIDLKGCPEDFQEAFLRYIAAYDAFADASREASGLRPIKRYLLGAPPAKSVWEVGEDCKFAERSLRMSAQRHSVQVP